MKTLKIFLVLCLLAFLVESCCCGGDNALSRSAKKKGQVTCSHF